MYNMSIRRSGWLSKLPSFYHHPFIEIKSLSNNQDTANTAQRIRENPGRSFELDTTTSIESDSDCECIQNKQATSKVKAITTKPMIYDEMAKIKNEPLVDGLKQRIVSRVCHHSRVNHQMQVKLVHMFICIRLCTVLMLVDLNFGNQKTFFEA